MLKFSLIFWGTLVGLSMCTFLAGCASTRPPMLTGSKVCLEYSMDADELVPTQASVKQHVSVSVTRQF